MGSNTFGSRKDEIIIIHPSFKSHLHGAKMSPGKKMSSDATALVQEAYRLGRGTKSQMARVGDFFVRVNIPIGKFKSRHHSSIKNLIDII